MSYFSCFGLLVGGISYVGPKLALLSPKADEVNTSVESQSSVVVAVVLGVWPTLSATDSRCIGVWLFSQTCGLFGTEPGLFVLLAW